MYALIDCNNFYVSCERLFNPKIKDLPVVLSIALSFAIISAEVFFIKIKNKKTKTSFLNIF